MITAFYTAERTNGTREGCCRAHYDIAADCPDTVQMHDERAPVPVCGWCIAEADVLDAQAAAERAQFAAPWWGGPPRGGR